MNCSRLTARIAGIESTAKTTSVVSISDQHGEQRRGQRAWRAPCVNSFWPSYSSVDGTTRCTSLSTGLFSGWTSSSSLPQRARTPVKMRNAPNTNSIHSNALEQRDAGEDEDEPQHQRAEDAPEQHAVLVLRGHGEVAEDQRPHEDVVDRRGSSRSGSRR